MDFDKLTRSHGVKVECAASVEECSLAIGEIVGHENVKSASRMNNAIVLFLGTVEKAREVIQSGVVINDTLRPVLPLSSPSKKIIISNVPPFIKDELIQRELERYGRLVSSIRKIPLGCKSPLLKHLVSFRRQVYMVLDNARDELNLVLKLRVDGFDYVVFVTSDSGLKCFKCGGLGHVVRDCPQKNENTGEQAEGLGGLNAVGPSTPVPLAPQEGSAPLEGGENAAVNNNNDNNNNNAQPNAVGAEISPVNVPASFSDPPGTVTVNELITKELEAFSECASDGSVTLAVQNDPTTADSGASGSKEPAAAVQDVDMDPSFKIPFKRKSDPDDGGESKAKKADANNDESDAESIGSNWSDCSQVEPSAADEKIPVRYKAEDIICFLRDTKGQKGVEVELFFPDRRQFIADVRQLKREGVFNEQENARLLKLLTKLRKRIRLEERSSQST